jgi:uncharacterized protein YdaU (DUF1376 family)
MPKAYMPFYTGDYLKDTRHRLTTWQHGAYMLTESPIDFKRACKIVEAYTKKQKEDVLFILTSFFKPVQQSGEPVQNFNLFDLNVKCSSNVDQINEKCSENNSKKLLNTLDLFWENTRLKKELDKYRDKEAKRIKAGSKGGKKRAENASTASSDAQAMLEVTLKQSESESESFKKSSQKKKNPPVASSELFFKEQGKPARATDLLKELSEEGQKTFFLQANEYLGRACKGKAVDLGEFGNTLAKITIWQAKGVNHADYVHFDERQVRSDCLKRAVDGLFKKDLGSVRSLKAFLLGAFRQNWKEWLPPENKAQRK